MKTYEEILSEMKNDYYSLTGTNADDAADIGIRLKVLAGQLFSLYARCENLICEAFPDTAGGEYLDKHAYERNIFRKEATKAFGQLTFFRETQSENALVIPEGTICASGGTDAKHFVTIEDAVIPAGELSVTVDAQAQEAGKAYNVPAGTVNVMITPPQSVISATNEHAFSGGADKEDDEALRRRLLDSYRTISNGANAAFYRELALRNENVSDAGVIPRKRGRGTVDVAIATPGNTPPDSQTIDEVTQALAQAREIGCDVQVYAAGYIALPVRVKVMPKDSYTTEQVISSVHSALVTLINSIGIGKTLYIKDIHAVLSAVEGLQNYTVVTPLTDYPLPADSKLSPVFITVEAMM